MLLIQALKQFPNLHLLNMNQIELVDTNDRFTTAFELLDRRCLVKIDGCRYFNLITLSNCL
jgi:hypothetical protein